MLHHHRALLTYAFSLLLLAPMLSSPAIATEPTAALREADVSSAGGETRVRLAVEGAFTVHTFTLAGPHRFICDLEGVVVPKTKTIPVDRNGILRVRIAQFATEPQPVARVVVDLAAALAPEVDERGTNVDLRFRQPQPTSAESPPPTRRTATGKDDDEPTGIVLTNDDVPSYVTAASFDADSYPAEPLVEVEQWYEVVDNSDQKIEIIGALANVSSDSVHDVSLELRAYDEQNALLTKRHARLDQSSIEAGEKLSFRVSLGIKGFSRLAFRVRARHL